MAGRKSKAQINDQLIDDLLLNKARKAKFDADRIKEVSELERLKKEQRQGSLVELKLVQETFTQIAAQTKAELYRLVTLLPPKLIGMESDQMADIIRSAIDETLINLYNGFKLDNTVISYEPEPEPEIEEDEE